MHYRTKFLRFLCLTISMLGLQMVWSCEMAQASPYLLSLGVSKSHIAIVLLAGQLRRPASFVACSLISGRFNRASERVNRAACRWSTIGQLQVFVGKAATLHHWRLHRLDLRGAAVRLGQGSRGSGRRVGRSCGEYSYPTWVESELTFLLPNSFNSRSTPGSPSLSLFWASS